MLLPQGSPTPNRIQNYRTLAYVVTTLVYLVIGAAIFDKLESENESIRHANLTARINKFKRQHNISDQDFRNLSRTVELRVQYQKKQWKFFGSFYYATVVLALIGYGHAIPSTKAGRAVTIGYALIGIPMWLIMIQSVGERLNALIRFVLKYFKRKFQKRRAPQITAMELLICEFLLIILTLATGSYVFHRYENWLYFDALYYCLLTLTTIGFGDFVPMQKHDYGKIDWSYILFCIMFILIGLTIVASSGNLLILRFVETNTKRHRHERLELEERRRQKVRIIGDVISSNGRLITLENTENSLSLIPSEHLPLEHHSSELSLCSCRGQTLCLPLICTKQFQRKKDKHLDQIRTLKEDFSDECHGERKNDFDENLHFQHSYLQTNKNFKRNSI